MDSQDQNIEGSSIKDSNVQQNQAGRDLTVNNIFLRLLGKSEPPQVDWDWGMDLLKRKQLPEIHKRLTDTLGSDRTLIDVPIEDQPHWVNRPLQADRILQIDGQDCGALDANQMLIETFRRDDIGGKLLILGAPGAGKTTALLSLAEQLVEGAISNPNTVIPVIFELSTWRDDTQSIESWLIKQLCYLDKGNPKIYEQWLERRVLLPLLDGLDELGLERQKKCTEKLNEFAEYYPQLVVCCRIKEFKMADINLRNLRGAVCLQPLSDSQIQNYFNSLNRLDIWSAIQENPNLEKLLKTTEEIHSSFLRGVYPQEFEVSRLESLREVNYGLLRTPLFINFFANAYDATNPILDKANLLDIYISRQLSSEKRFEDRRFELKGYNWAYETVKLEPNQEKAYSHLQWLARYLQNSNNVDFFIYEIQPGWVEPLRSKTIYHLIYWTISLLTAALCSCLENHGKIVLIDIATSLLMAFSCQALDTSFSQMNKKIAELTNICSIAELTKPLIYSIVGFYLIKFILFKFSLLQCWSVGLSQASFFILAYGGYLRRLSLHIFLQQSGLPWNFTRFLDYCVERRLLLRIGSSYRFLHRELLDHFCSIESRN